MLKAQTKDLPPTINGKEALYILDGKETDKSALGTVDPNAILEVNVLKDADATIIYGSKGVNGVVVIATKKYAISSYQEKLSQLCDEYESYLTGHGTDDSVIAYNLDGKPLPKDDSGISTLYHLPRKKINEVVFTEKEPEGSKFLVRILITTEQ
jgi:TonB-dependent SusC/RagA subfamily outer membrane receptor